MSSESCYDAIVIGSGMGALAFASVMAKLRKWRVLILERHFKIGGFTHTFSRPGGWTWDVGLHYVGQMGPGMMGRRLSDFLTDGFVKWNPLPDPFEKFIYPGLTFSVPNGEAHYLEALVKVFPEEQSNIEQYFRDLRAAFGWFNRHSMAGSVPGIAGRILKAANRLASGHSLLTTQEYLERRFREPRLRALVASQWGDYGLPPGKSSFAVHALIATHYFSGAWYPDGGAGMIAEGAGSVIRAAGGDLLPNHEVTRILLDGNRATGVEVSVKKGKQGSTAQFHAPVIVSDAGAWNTFTKLLPAEFPLPFRADLAMPPEGYEAVTLYLGLRGDPGVLGFRGENHWIYSSFDHDEMFERRDELLSGHANLCYLSLPSTKDHQAKRHTAEIIAPFSFHALASHRDEPWRRRADDYEAAKKTISNALLDLVERHHHGFRDLVEYEELATPLTFEHFTGAPSGASYGYPGTQERFRKPWLRVDTPVRNLYLTGSDTGSLGIMGAMMGGIGTASRLLGPLGFFRVMRAAGVNLSKG
jgi:all-trans-retinol 13,14-reductase